MFKRLVLTAALACGLTPLAAHAADNTQQNRMSACNAEAATKSLSGDARKSFMSDCLSGKTAAGKEQACNAQADQKKLAGAARTSFVKKCAS